MIKKALLTVFALILILGLFSCGDDEKESTKSNNSEAEEAPIITNSHAIEHLGLEWFFVPKESKEIKTKEANTNKVEVSFKGCGYKEINDYAEDIEKNLKWSGYELYVPVLDSNNKLVGIEKALKLKAVIDDEYFSGVAYSFTYRTKNGFTTVVLKYYGSAGGKYGNGQCKVLLQDSTEQYAPFYEVAGNG